MKPRNKSIMLRNTLRKLKNMILRLLSQSIFTGYNFRYHKALLPGNTLALPKIMSEIDSTIKESFYLIL